MAKNNRIKKWMQYNKAAVIWIAIILVYTLIMLGIIFGFGFDFKSCSSGSLTDTKNADNVNIETSMKPAS